MDTKTVALGVCAVAAAGAIWLVSGNYPTTDDLAEGLGAAFFPRLIAVGTGLIGIVIAIQGLIARQPTKSSEADPRHLWRPAAFVAVILIYFWALRTIGFLGATAPFLAAEMAIMRVPTVKAILYAVGVTAVTFLLFEVVLEVPLPAYALPAFW